MRVKLCDSCKSVYLGIEDLEDIEGIIMCPVCRHKYMIALFKKAIHDVGDTKKYNSVKKIRERLALAIQDVEAEEKKV